MRSAAAAVMLEHIRKKHPQDELSKCPTCRTACRGILGIRTHQAKVHRIGGSHILCCLLLALATASSCRTSGHSREGAVASSCCSSRSASEGSRLPVQKVPGCRLARGPMYVVAGLPSIFKPGDGAKWIQSPTLHLTKVIQIPLFKTSGNTASITTLGRPTWPRLLPSARTKVCLLSTSCRPTTACALSDFASSC